MHLVSSGPYPLFRSVLDFPLLRAAVGLLSLVLLVGGNAEDPRSFPRRLGEAFYISCRDFPSFLSSALISFFKMDSGLSFEFRRSFSLLPLYRPLSSSPPDQSVSFPLSLS